MLKDLLSEKNIALQVEASTWEKVVRTGGELMKASGLIEDRYIEAMVRTVRELGPYIVIAPGIAMPHARPEDGALAVGTAVVTLKEPVNFGNKDNDPVTVAVFLCAVDKNAHLQVLSDLMTLFEDEDFPQKAQQFRTPEEFMTYVEELTEPQT